MIAKSYVYVVQVAMGTSQVQYFCRRLRTPLNKSDEMSNVIKEAEVGQPAPEFKQFDFMLHATIRKIVPQDDTQDGKITGNQINKGGTQDVPQDVPQAIFELISANNKITRESIATQLGLSSKTIARHLKQMSDRVHYVGSGYSGHWEVIPPEKKD